MTASAMVSRREDDRVAKAFGGGTGLGQ